MNALALTLTFVISFLLGSIPWGIVISRLFYRTDIRKHGSGNIGTTNVMRTLGKTGGAVVFLLDFGKGLLSGLVAALLYIALVKGDSESFVLFYPSSSSAAAQTMLAVAFFACTTGHIFSPWLKFKGGKGIAAGAGCLFLTLGWMPTLLELGLFVLFVLLTRYVSLGSIMALSACFVISAWVLWGNVLAIALCVLPCLFSIWAHRGNIKRLLSGTEPKLGSRST